MIRIEGSKTLKNVRGTSGNIIKSSQVLDFIGAAWVTRTPDPIITNDVLYRLS
jgi:hypothetical protein